MNDRTEHPGDDRRPRPRAAASVVPVICDRCRSTGIAGEADFSHLGDLLEFEPVPRKKERVDGWSPEKQRAFIAILSATGSKRRAAMAIGMKDYGVTQLLKAEGSDSFKAAFDRAMAIARANGSMKIAQGVADAAARHAQLTPPSRLRGLAPSPGSGEGWGEGDDDAWDMSEDEKLQLLENLAGRFMKKVAAERRARLGGELVAADFYLRQITFLEVLFDLTASEFGWDPQDLLRDLRRGGHAPVEIVSTPFAEWLDTRRRIWWLEEGQPERPPHPDARFAERHDQGPWGSRGPDGYSLAIDQNATGAHTTPARGYTPEQWATMNAADQIAARQKQFDEDAEAQAEWERKAIADWEARQGEEGEEE